MGGSDSWALSFCSRGGGVGGPDFWALCAHGRGEGWGAPIPGLCLPSAGV